MADLPLHEAHKQWIEQNPLRRWRKDNRISIQAASGMLHVSLSTIQLWEAGTEPNEQNMEKLTRVLGPNAPRRWKAWLEANPAHEAFGDLETKTDTPST